MTSDVPEREAPWALFGLAALVVLVGGGVFLVFFDGPGGREAAPTASEQRLSSGSAKAEPAEPTPYDRIVAARTEEELWALGEELFYWDPETKDLDLVELEELRDYLFQDLKLSEYEDSFEERDY